MKRPHKLVLVVALSALVLGIASCEKSDDPTTSGGTTPLAQDGSVGETGSTNNRENDAAYPSNNTDASDSAVPPDGSSSCVLTGSTCAPDPNCCPPVGGNRFKDDSGSGCVEKVASPLACTTVAAPHCLSQNFAECFVSKTDATAVFVVSESPGEMEGFDKCSAAVAMKASQAPPCN